MLKQLLLPYSCDLIIPLLSCLVSPYFSSTGTLEGGEIDCSICLPILHHLLYHCSGISFFGWWKNHVIFSHLLDGYIAQNIGSEDSAFCIYFRD